MVIYQYRPRFGWTADWVGNPDRGTNLADFGGWVRVGFLKICLCTFVLVGLILVRYFAHNSTILSGGSIEM